MKNKVKNMYFNDFIKLNRGFDLPNDKIIKGNYPVVASSEVKAFHRDFKVKGPGVITGRSGSLGKVQYVTEDYWPLNTTLYVKDFKNNYPLYVKYYLKTMHLENYNSGAGVPTLNQNHLHKIKVKVHDKDEQVRIANILHNYDKLIENNNKRKSLLENIAQEIYKEWFVRMRFPGCENKKFKKGIPIDWDFVRIDELYDTKSGGTPSRNNDEYYKSGTIKWVKTGELNDSFVLDTDEKITEEALKHSSAKIYPSRSVLIAMYGATVGKLGITNTEVSSNQACCALISKNNIFDYKYIYLNLLFSRKELINLSMGAAQQNISQQEIRKFKVLKPDETVMKQFNSLIGDIFNSIENILKRDELLSKKRDLLLPRLMSGKISVE